MKAYRSIIGHVSLLVITGHFTACDARTESERLYQSSLSKLRDIAAETEERVSTRKIEHEPVLDGNVVIQGSTAIRDHLKAAEYLMGQRKSWERLEKDFRSLVESSAKSRWVDDALFCIAFGHSMYLSHYDLDDRESFEMSAEVVEEFIRYEGQIQLEEWTKKELDIMFTQQLSMMTEAPEDSSEKTRLDGIFLFWLANAHYRFGDRAKGKQYYEEVVELLPGSLLADSATVQVEMLPD